MGLGHAGHDEVSGKLGDQRVPGCVVEAVAGPGVLDAVAAQPHGGVFNHLTAVVSGGEQPRAGQQVMFAGAHQSAKNAVLRSPLGP